MLETIGKIGAGCQFFIFGTQNNVRPGLVRIQCYSLPAGNGRSPACSLRSPARNPSGNGVRYRPTDDRMRNVSSKDMSQEYNRSRPDDCVSFD